MRADEQDDGGADTRDDVDERAELRLEADRLEVRGRDSAGLHVMVTDHGLDLSDPTISGLIGARATDPLFTTGAVRALIDAKNPFIPVAGEAENGFRKLIAEHAKDGLKGWSYGQSPALVAISLKAAIAALQAKRLVQPEIHLIERRAARGTARGHGFNRFAFEKCHDGQEKYV